MNIYATIIAAALLAEYLLHLIADLLNLRSLGSGVPEEFAGVYDAGTYRKSQEYTRTRARFGLIVSTVMLAVTLVFWFAGGFNALDRIVRGWGFGEIGTGLAYIGILAFGRAALSLPLGVYSTFVISSSRITPSPTRGASSLNASAPPNGNSPEAIMRANRLKTST